MALAPAPAPAPALALAPDPNTLTLTLALAPAPAPAPAPALALAPDLNSNQDVARRQLGTNVRTCKLRLATFERNTPIASLQAPLARQGALERWRRACADATTAASLTDKLVDFIDSLDAAQASTHLVGAAAQARLALRSAAAGSSSAARSDEAAAASLLKDTLGTLMHACALALALALALARALPSPSPQP